MNWYLKVLKQYADFSGRARRKEYWMFVLFQIIITFILVIPLIIFGEDGENGFMTYLFVGIIGLYFLATFIPTLAVTVRRLHDTGKSGWFYLINFIPYIGGFIILIFTCMDSQHKSNQWGENPKGIGNDSSISQIGRE